MGNHRMRLASLVVIASVCSISGCAGLMASSGKVVTNLKTKEEVHAHFGEPAVSGIAGAETYEEFHTRRKISEAESGRFGEGYAMLWWTTLGTIDLICVPHELYLLGHRTLCGQTIRFGYDRSGTVTGIYLDGESLGPIWRFPHAAARDD